MLCPFLVQFCVPNYALPVVVFGRCRNKEPHSSGILLCRVVVVGYEK